MTPSAFRDLINRFYAAAKGVLIASDAMRDAVNVTARLAAVAGAGEVLVTDAASRAAGREGGDGQRRELALRGRSELLPVTVLTTVAA